MQQSQRSARPYELHGFVVKAIEVAQTGLVTIDMMDRTRAFLEIQMDGLSELATPRADLDRIAGERVDDFKVETRRLLDGQGRPGVDHALVMTLTTCEDGPTLELIWTLHPEAGEEVDERLLHIAIEGRPEDIIH